jgi:hypothetical protein
LTELLEEKKKEKAAIGKFIKATGNSTRKQISLAEE